MSEKMDVKHVPSHYLMEGSEMGKVDVAYIFKGHSKETTHRYSEIRFRFLL